MSFLDGLWNKMNLSSTDDYEDYEDDYDDNDNDIAGEEESETKPAPKAEAKAAEEAPASVSRKKAPKTVASKVVQINTNNKAVQSEVCMIIPKEYRNSQEIAEILMSGKAVVLNMEAMEIETAQRVIDFTYGACYTMGGNLQKISKKIIIATPSNVELSGDFSELLKDEDNVDMNNYNLKV